MTPNISDYTFEKLIKYDSSNASQLIRKLEIEIKSLELEIQYRLDFRVKANSFTRPIIPAGTKMHFSHPKRIYEKYMDTYDTRTRSKQSQLKDLKDEKQRVLLNQSLRGIDNFTSLQFTPFVFNSDVIWNPSWQTSKTILDTETGKLSSQLSKWKNNEMLKKEKIPEKVTIAQDKIIPIEKVTMVENQTVTFNEQTNSGDFNETPITDVNLSGGCSECTGIKSVDPIPEKQLKEGYMKMAGIAALGIIGLMVLKK